LIETIRLNYPPQVVSSTDLLSEMIREEEFMKEGRISTSGIRETHGLSKQIERTRKLRFPEGEDALTYWFRPPAPPPIDFSKLPPDPDGDEELKDGDVPTTPPKVAPRPEASSSTPAPAPQRESSIRPAIAPSMTRNRTQTPPKVPETFNAMIVDRDDAGTVTRSLQSRPLADLPGGEGDVLIRVDFSSLNYKDAMAASGHPGVAGKFPLAPGIDAAGVVAESHAPVFQPGDEVIVTGFDLGTYFDGGFGRYIRVPYEWIVRCPLELDLYRAMCVGTAGMTAMLSVNELERNGVTPRSGEILVTGATGGVGTMTIGLLAQAGYSVVALSGKPEQTGLLTDLGAAEVIDRAEYLATNSKKPLLTSRWAGIVDTVGGEVLEVALKEAQYGATVTCCGMVAGADLSTSVYPFILRGIRLVGIESAFCPIPLRNKLWRRLSQEWDMGFLKDLSRAIGLNELDDAIQAMLDGNSVGRVVLRH
jgi:acrylyl-CoA reductase (NADPH)